jgi:hypothetical protein
MMRMQTNLDACAAGRARELIGPMYMWHSCASSRHGGGASHGGGACGGEAAEHSPRPGRFNNATARRPVQYDSDAAQRERLAPERDSAHRVGQLLQSKDAENCAPSAGGYVRRWFHRVADNRAHSTRYAATLPGAARGVRLGRCCFRRGGSAPRVD